MGCLHLHIGTPKTGTSSIQFFLAKNKKLLAGKGYCFPAMPHFDKIGQNRNAHFLVHRYFDENKKRIREKEEDVRSGAMKKLLERLEKFDHVILTDESIWTTYHMYDDFWNRLYRDVTEQGHTMKVIVYLRRQDSYVQSFWAEDVKAGQQERSFASYLKSNPWKRIHIDYFKTLETIAEVVGEENITVRVFERGQFLDSSLYADFLHCIGLSLTEEYNCTENKNNPVFGEYIQIKQILNKNPIFAESKGFMTNLLYAATMQHEGKPDYQRAAVFPEGQANFLKQFEAGNAQIAKKYLHREDGKLFYDMPSEDNEIKAYSTEELVTACGDIILELKKQLDAAKGEIILAKNENDTFVAAQQSLKVSLKHTANLSKKRLKNLLRRRKK